MNTSKKKSITTSSRFWHSKAFKRIRLALLLLLIFSIGTVYGVNNNPKYLAWSEQQDEIKAQVAKETEKIQADAKTQIAEATKAANATADKKAADAKKEQESVSNNTKPETKTVEKVVEKKVQFVHADCETLITRYNYLFKMIEVDLGNSPGISSTISIAHNNDMQSMAKNCLKNQAYIPRGVVGGRANQTLWDNWK